MTPATRAGFPSAALASVVAVVLLAGCSGGGAGDDAAAPAGSGATVASPTSDDASPADDAGSDSTAPDPCSLVDSATLTSAYGVEFGEGSKTDSEPAASRGFRACTWENSGGTQSFVLQTVAGGDTLGQSAAELYDQSVTLYPDSAEGGAGDRSILLQREGGFLALVGDVFVQGNPIVLGADLPAGSNAAVLKSVVDAIG